VVVDAFGFGPADCSQHRRVGAEESIHADLVLLGKILLVEHDPVVIGAGRGSADLRLDRLREPFLDHHEAATPAWVVASHRVLAVAHRTPQGVVEAPDDFLVGSQSALPPVEARIGH
jgi:hypothetical protein